MIGTIMQVARGEGLGSVVTRATERVSETRQRAVRLVRGAFARTPEPALLNVSAMPPDARLGGVPVQLQARLAEEKKLREVALWHDGVLEVDGRAWRMQPHGARTVIVEGGFGESFTLDDRVDTILVVHDFSLMRDAAPLLPRARTVVFPSQFLCDAYRAVVPHFEARLIEPGIPCHPERGRRVGGSEGPPSDSALVVHRRGSFASHPPTRLAQDDSGGHRVAFAGSVKLHKGGALLPDIIRGTDAAEWHVFGGGDFELLRDVRALNRATVHGYYRAGALPHLLARHRIGLVVLPSIVPESFSLTLSECWSVGVPVVAFDHGAIADRVRAHGGGFLVPPEAGAEGIAAAVREWLRGGNVQVPERVPTAREAAAAHVALYRELGVLP
jgi:glycosyltransferase involved in cell wall biosynthesis